MQDITAFHFCLPLLPSKKAPTALTRLCHKIWGGEDHQHSEALWRARLVVAFYCLPTLPQLLGITGFYRPAASTLLMSAEMRQGKRQLGKYWPKWFGVEVGSEVDFVITQFPGEYSSCFYVGLRRLLGHLHFKSEQLLMIYVFIKYRFKALFVKSPF